MREKIENRLTITIDGDLDLTKATKLKIYIRQGYTYLEYAPSVVDATTLSVTVPYVDAMRLTDTAAQVQLVCRGEAGEAIASDVLTVPVDQLLSEEGYSGT